MRLPTTLDRRSALVVAAGGVGAALTAGCSGSIHPPSPAHAPTPVQPSALRNVDPDLRERAIADEQRLLAACAAPAGQEPFATLRRLHQDHLRLLTGQAAPTPGVAAGAPAAPQLAAAERATATARQADCVRASPSLAPLLASLAASAEVAAVLLTP